MRSFEEFANLEGVSAVRWTKRAVAYAESEPEQVQQLVAQMATTIGERIDTGLVGLDRWGQRLLSFAVLELSEVEGSDVMSSQGVVAEEGAGGVPYSLKSPTWERQLSWQEL